LFRHLSLLHDQSTWGIPSSCLERRLNHTG
jgi:hypothetical protein